MVDVHRITVTPAGAHVEIRVGGRTVGESDRALVLRERGVRPRWYLPRDDVRTDLLRPSATVTACPFKGRASYWSLEVDGQTHPDLAWSYEDPLPRVRSIAGLLCFYDERAELLVDGARPA